MQTEMITRPENLADFEQPPLYEVAVAVQFKELSKFTSVHYGLLFEQFKEDFPAFEDHAPLSVRFETFGRSGDQVRPLGISEKPPLRRVWFVSEDGHRLIQIQPNRFVYNWRKVSDEGDYPRFEKILPSFIAEFEKFKKSLSSLGLGELEINQCELSYFNNIELLKKETLDAAFLRVFSVWDDHGSVRDLSLSKTEIETPNFKTQSRILAKDDGQPIGRLHVEALPASKALTDEELIRLSLIFRGPPIGDGIQGFESFFSIGREVIVDRFASITSDESHRKWGKIK